MDRKIAERLMSANTPMGRAFRDHILNGISPDKALEILNVAKQTKKTTKGK